MARNVAAFRKGLHETGDVEGTERDGRVPPAGGPIRSPADAGGRSGPADRRHAWQVSLLAVAGGRRFMPTVLASVTVMASYGHSRAGKTGCSHVN